MDEDCDLVIDLDDEREETPHGSNNRDEEMRPIIYINNNNENKNMKQHSHKELQETINVIQSPNSDHNSDDNYIQVIDDDDYEHSVQKLISAANKISRDYLKNKQLKEATANKILNDSQVYKSDSINGGITNQVLDHRTLHKLGLGKNQDSMCDSRNRIFSCVKENRIAETTSYRPSYESQYVMEDIPHHRNGNTFRKMDGYMQDVRTLPNIQYARHAYRYYDTERPEVDSSIDDHYPIMDRYEYRHTHRPEIPLRNYFYPHDPINRNTYFNVQRPTLNTNCRYKAMPRDTHNHHYLPEDMLSIDEYRRAEINRAPQFYSHRPYLISLDDYYYRHTAMEADAYTYAHRPHELVTSDYGNTISNGFPYSHYIPDHALDDYWQAMMSRHAYRPENVISMEDCERSLRYWHAYGNAYKPPIGLSLDPYRSVELPHVYRPDIVNMDTCREPTLPRNAFYPETAGMYCHRQEINPYRTEIDDTNRNDDCTRNLSRKQETTITAVNTPRNARNDENKLRTILSTGNQASKAPLNTNKRFKKSGNLDLPVYKYKNSLHRTMEDHIKSNTTTLSVNKPESEHMNICKPGVPVITNRPDTVILSTKNIYQKSTHNQIAQSDDLAASEIIRESSHKIRTTAKEIEYHGLDKNAKQFTHEVNKTHEEKGVDRESNAGDKDISIQLLVVFFTRVKELVKDTFPEFSKSLEKEIGNLGKRTNSGRLKTDIQYICPLYCSVSTYSLLRFDNTDDDNRIEKHVNRGKICDVCSCIQNCYKLYKKKYFNLVSTQSASSDKQENDARKGNETINVNLPIESARGIRAQTVICRRQGTDCKEIGIGESRRNVEMDINEKLQRNHRQANTNSIISNKDTYGADTSTVIDKHHIASLHDKKLLDSLSVLNFSLPSKNIENMNSPNWVPTISIDDNDISLRIDTHNNRMEIEKPVLNTINDKKEIIIDYSSQNRLSLTENRVDKQNEAKLILSLSFNEITNADTIASKEKDKLSKKPDTVFTCHICSCTFTYFTTFVSHMRVHNINEIDEGLTDECIARKCPFCGVYSKQKYHNEHVKRSHPEIFTRKEEPSKELIKVNKRRKSMKRKFIFTCLVCHKNLKSCEVQRHREIEHKGLKVVKMFTKKLSSMD